MRGRIGFAFLNAWGYSQRMILLFYYPFWEHPGR